MWIQIHKEDKRMILAQNETIVKEWQYGSSQIKDEKIDYSLVVTNKRVISAQHGKLTNARQEVCVDDICAISTSNVKQSILGAIILIALGALFAIIGLVSIGVAGVLVGIFVAALGVIALLKASSNFEVYVYTNTRDHLSLAISRSTFIRKRAGKVLKIKVDKAMADEIVETLGAIVLGAK